MHSTFWHPFPYGADVEKHEVVICRGEGCWVWEEAGRRYLDATMVRQEILA